MTLTYSIDNVSTVTADVAVPQIDQSDLVLASLDTDAKSAQVTARYVLVSTDPTHPLTVIVRAPQFVAAKNGQPARLSISLGSFARVTDSLGVLDANAPITATLSIVVPSSVLVEATDLLDMIGNLYGLTFSVLTSKVPDADEVGKILFGVPRIYS